MKARRLPPLPPGIVLPFKNRSPLLAPEPEPEPTRRGIQASPFVWIDPAKIPRRKWVYGRHYIRKFITETAARSGEGKSSLAIGEGLSISTGLPLLGVIPDERLRVWYWNGEDPMEELQRRIAAVVLRYGIDPAELAGWFFLDTGRETKIIIAEQTRTGAVVARPIVEQVIDTIFEHQIGLMIIDPFVASHRVTENETGAMEMVAATWAEIADVTGCAIELVHHTRKTGGADVTVEDARGSSALLAKARSARVLNGMSKEDAEKAGVENRRFYFRVENGKASMSPAPDKADWYRTVGVDLGNGDEVGAVERWTWPDAFDGVETSHLRAVQAAIAVGRWRESVQAKDWAGNAVAGVMDLDVANRAHKSKIAKLLKTWIANGVLVVVEGEDANRISRKFIEVGTSAND
jgi:AAA domain-containing protein